MAGLTPTERDAGLDTEKARLVYASIHTADPGATGASEATGGSPAYARLALVFGADASGASTAGSVTFDLPAGTYPYFGLWSAVTAGTFRGGNALSSSVTLGAQGQLQLTVTLTATTS